ncbi:ABC transporter substrate-binding protein [Acerihabitans sp.]|uniref:ABC transporter substrate-binding protein n=1 Tax=Acerihabitans sp. TaxID=2811394 RepID=UPI002EDA7990
MPPNKFFMLSKGVFVMIFTNVKNILLATLFSVSLSSMALSAENLKLTGGVYQQLYSAALANNEKEVIFYSPASPEDSKLLSELWKTNFPKIHLTIVGKKAPDLITQIEAERAAKQYRADVTTMSQPYVAVIWKQKGYYLPYKVSTFDKLAPDYADADGAYYSIGVYLLPAAYNTRAIADKSGLPHTLADFLDPKWKGKIVLADPTTAGNSLTFFLALLQTGKIDWSYLEKLAKQDVMFVRGNPEAARILASGERSVSPMVSSFNILTSRDQGQAIDLYSLDDGTLVTQQPSGIMSNPPHPTAAKLLLEVLTDAQAQELRADAGKYWPTNADAGSVDGLPKLAAFKPYNVDLSSLSNEKATQDFLSRFNKTFGRE